MLPKDAKGRNPLCSIVNKWLSAPSFRVQQSTTGHNILAANACPSPVSLLPSDVLRISSRTIWYLSPSLCLAFGLCVLRDVDSTKGDDFAFLKLRPQLEHAWCAVIFKPWVADQGPSGEPWRTWRTYQISPTYPFQLSDSDWFLNVVKLVEICPTWCWLVAHPGQPCDFRCPKRKAIPLLRPGLSRGHHLLGQWMAVVKPVKGPPQGDVNGVFLDVNGTLTEPWDPGLSKTTCNMEMP